MIKYNYIRFLYFNKKLSKRAIAKEMGIHRDTVTKAIENSEHKYNQITPRSKLVNQDFKEKVLRLVKENQDKPKRAV